MTRSWQASLDMDIRFERGSACSICGQNGPCLISKTTGQPWCRTCKQRWARCSGCGDQVLLRLGDPPTPVPEPVAVLLLEHLGQRTNMRTATNHASRWLFPGRRADQPLQVRLAIVSFYSALTLVANYHGQRQQLLVNWEDEVLRVLPSVLTPSKTAGLSLANRGLVQRW